jgi:GT2 family glycosyltransferase
MGKGISLTMDRAEPHPQVSCVVVSWNSGAELDRCLESIRRAESRAAVTVEIGVVDNASDDDSRSVAARRADWVIENHVNVGFAFAVNQGIARAAGVWTLLLNPDAELAENFIVLAESCAMRAGPEVACIVPQITFAEHRDLIQSRGLGLTRHWHPVEIGCGTPRDRPGKRRTIFGGSGGALFLRTSVARSLGGLDPAFFAYFEDADFAYRLGSRGLQVVLEPDLEVIHAGSTATIGRSGAKLRLVARGRRLFVALNAPRNGRNRATTLGVETAIAVGNLATEKSWGSFRGLVDGLRCGRYVRFRRSAEREANGGRHSYVPAEFIQEFSSFRSLVADRLRSRRLYAKGPSA